MAGTTGPGGADDFDGGGAASDIGWLRAHVRIGRSYPLIAVRVYRRAVAGGGIVQALDSEDKAVLNALAYAIVFAHQVDELELRVGQLETDVSLVGPEDIVSVELRLWLDSPLSGGVDENLLRDLARRELAAAIAAGKWDLGSAAVHVLLMQVGTSAEVEVAESAPPAAPASAQAAASSSPSDSASEPKQRLIRQGADWRRVALVLVVLLAVGLIGRGALMWSDLSQGGERPSVAANPVATAALPAQPAPTRAPPTPTPFSQPTVATNVPAAPAATQPAATAAAQPAPPTATQPAAPAATQPAAATAAQLTAPAATQPAPTPTSAAEVAAARATSVPPTAEPVLLDFAPNRASGLAWPNDPSGVGWFAPDGYHLAARNQGNFVAIGVLPTEQPASAVLSATFHKLGGPIGGGYGLIVGDQGPGPRDGISQGGNYVVFEIGDKGEVGAWRRAQDHWVDILGWTPSGAVKQGLAENTMELRVSPSGVAFSVNGTAIPLPPAEKVGVGGIGVFLGGDSNQAVLTRLTVTRLD